MPFISNFIIVRACMVHVQLHIAIVTYNKMISPSNYNRVLALQISTDQNYRTHHLPLNQICVFATGRYQVCIRIRVHILHNVKVNYGIGS